MAENKDFLNGLTNYKTGFAMIKSISIIIIIAAISFSAFIYYQSEQKVAELRNQVVVIEQKSGQNFSGKYVQSNDTRIFEFKNASKTCYTYLYQFDQNSFLKNMDKALLLMGNSGKERIKAYQDEAILSKLKQKNLILTIDIPENDNNVVIEPIVDIANINDKGIIVAKGTIKGFQTFIIGQVTKNRNMHVTFDIYNVDRSDANPHGVLLDNWKEIEKSYIE